MIGSGGVVNAAGDTTIAAASPGALVAIYGRALAAAATITPQPDGAGRLPTAADGTRVLLANLECPLLYVSPDQLNRGSDNAIWNRIHIVPFEITILPGEIDDQLPEKLLAEAEGILAWAVRGALQWQREGLGRPPEIHEAGTIWRAESDPFREFVDECCVLRSDLSVKAAVLWQAYEKWAVENGERAVLHRTEFADRLRGLGCERVKRHFGRLFSEHGWSGITLRALQKDADADSTSDGVQKQDAFGRADARP